MTLNSTTNRISYAGNGVTTVFSFPYRFLADADLVVIARNNTTGVETTKTLTTHYTVSGAGDAAGGSVTMLTAPASGVSLIIYRDPTMTQLVDLVENDPLPVETAVEQPLDRLTMIAQRNRDLIGRALRLPEGDTGFVAADMYLPAAVDRASNYLAFNADGKPIAAAAPTSVAPSAFVATLLDDTTSNDFLTTLKTTRSETGAAAVPVLTKLREFVSVKDFGAVGDGVADDTAEIQAAIDSGAKHIYIPAGTYLLSSVLTIRSNVYLYGAGPKNTILRQNTNFNVIKVDSVSGGFGLRGFQIYNSQASASVTSGAGLWLVSSDYGVLDNLYINNVYDGIKVESAPILRAHAVDIQYFKNCGWTFSGGNNYDAYVSKSVIDGQLAGVANGQYSVKLYDHCDEIIFDSCVLNLAAYSLHISAVSSGAGVRPAYCRFRNCSFDSATNGVEVDRAVDTVFEGCFFSSATNGCTVGATDAVGTTFIGCMFANSGRNGMIIGANAVNTKVIGCNVISNSRDSASTYHGISVAAGATDFQIIGNTITNGWGFPGTQGYGIVINAGASTRYSIVDNNVSGNGTAGISDGATGSPARNVSGNHGFVTRSSGNDTIASGTTSKTVNHGLAVTPGGDDITLSFITSSTNDPGNFWVTAVGATQFTVNVRNDPGASGLVFTWVAEAMTP